MCAAHNWRLCQKYNYTLFHADEVDNTHSVQRSYEKLIIGYKNGIYADEVSYSPNTNRTVDQRLSFGLWSIKIPPSTTTRRKKWHAQAVIIRIQDLSDPHS